MATQRIWRRVEAPGTYRGHALEATLHGARWLAWEERDGSWLARRDGGAPVLFAEWTDLRRAAERGDNPSPPPVPPQCRAAVDQIRRLLGALMRSVGCHDDGRLWVTVAPGQADNVLSRLSRAHYPYHVLVMEGP